MDDSFCNFQIRSMSMYLLDLALTEVAFVHFVASLLAASAIYVSRGLLAAQGGEWNKSLAHYTKYSEKDLESCVKAMRRMLSKRKNSKFQVSWHDTHCALRV